MLMPGRARIERPAGLRATPAASELKPNSTLPQSESTPPTTAASARPSSSSRAPCANTLALEEQAVATVTATLLQTEHVLQELAGGMRRVHCLVAQVLGKLAGRQSGVGRPPRWRRCWRWTCPAPARRGPRHSGARRRDRLEEAVPLQAQPREPVVAAFVSGEVRRAAAHPRRPHAADPGSQWLTPKSLGAQAGAPGVERSQQLCAAGASGAGGREGGNAERLHSGSSRDQAGGVFAAAAPIISPGSSRCAPTDCQ